MPAKVKVKVNQKGKEKDNENGVKYAMSINNNRLVLQKIHDLTSLLFGTISAILQLESLNGIVAFVIGYLVVNVIFAALVTKEKELSRFYQSLWGDLVMMDLGRSVSSYIMMWCLVYALIDS